jgi:hypothetical protein
MTVILPEAGPAARTGYRWSSVRSCARKAVYERTGAPQRDRSRTEEGYLWRGKQLGRDFAIILAHEERKRGNRYRIKVASGLVGDWPRRWVTSDLERAGFVVEEPVRWPFGVLHPDIRHLETDTLIEVLSSTHADDAQVSSKMLQLVGQMHYSDATAGMVVVVNPANPLDYDQYPIVRSSRAYQELVEEVEARVNAIAAWHDGGPLPARVCRKPGDARRYYCRFADHCFAGVEPPEPDQVFESAAAVAAANELYRAKQEEHAAKEAYDQALGRRRQAEQEIAELVDDAGNPQLSRVGPLEIRRIVVSDRHTFKLAKARTAGVWSAADEERFALFMDVGGGHVRWQVDRVGEEPLDDFGEVPY